MSTKIYTCFFNRSHRSSHHQNHAQTATRPHIHTRYHTAMSCKVLTLVAWLSLLLLLAESQRGAFLVPLANSVYHTTAAARGIDPMLPTTAAPAIALAALALVQPHERSFGGFRSSSKPPTRWDEGSSSRCPRRKRENHRAANRFRLLYSSTPAHQPPLGKAQKL